MRKFTFIEQNPTGEEVPYWDALVQQGGDGPNIDQFDILEDEEKLTITKELYRDVRKELVKHVTQKMADTFLSDTDMLVNHPKLSQKPDTLDALITKATQKRESKKLKTLRKAKQEWTRWNNLMQNEEVPAINDFAALQHHYVDIAAEVFGDHASFFSFCYVVFIYSRWREGRNLTQDSKQVTYEVVCNLEDELKKGRSADGTQTLEQEIMRQIRSARAQLARYDQPSEAGADESDGGSASSGRVAR